MRSTTPQQAAQNWANGMSAAGEKMKAGVMAVQTSPTQLAAAAVDRMLLGIQRAIASGKLQAALQGVSLQDWQNAMINKGLPRIATGATAAKPKFQAFMTQFLPFLQTGVQQLNANNPRGDLEQNLNRMVAMARYNSTFKMTR